MKTLRYLLEKEFRQIFRDPSILRMIFMMPIIQLVILPQAANYEIKNVKIGLIIGLVLGLLAGSIMSSKSKK